MTLRMTETSHLGSLSLSLDRKALFKPLPGSYPFIFYPEDVRERLTKTLRKEGVTILPYAVFTGHGYLPHVGGKWWGKQCLRNHMYLLLEEVELKEDIAFVNGNDLSMSLKADVGGGGVDRAVAGERNIRDGRSKDDEQVQVGVNLDED